MLQNNGEASSAIDAATLLVLPSKAALDRLPHLKKEQLLLQQNQIFKQCEALQAILALQESLTGTNPLSGNGGASTVAESANLGSGEANRAATPPNGQDEGPPRVSTSPVAGPSESDSSPAGKVSRLSQSAEQTLLLYFSLNDTLSKEATMYLAKEAHCTEVQVREYFARLRSSVRNFQQKLQRKASGFPVGSHAAPAGPGIPSAALQSRQAGGFGNKLVSTSNGGESSLGSPKATAADQITRLDAVYADGFAKLQKCLTPTGNLESSSVADEVATIMKTSQSWRLREACLSAIAKSSGGPLRKLASVANMMAMLASWITQAEVEGQTSFLRTLLRALKNLGLNPANTKFNSLPAALFGLQKHRCTLIRELANALLLQAGLQEVQHKKRSAILPQGIDPSQMAVPLNRSLSLPRKPGHSALQHKRRQGPDDRPLAAHQINLAKATQRAKPVGANLVKNGPSKMARLDASSLADVKGPARLSSHRLQPQMAVDGNQVYVGQLLPHNLARMAAQQDEHRHVLVAQLQDEQKDNRESQQHLERLQTSRRSLEALQCQRAVAEMRSKPVQPQTVPMFPPLQLEDLHADPRLVPASGEDSSEVHSLQQQMSSEEVCYRQAAEIPFSPAEPIEASRRGPDPPIARIPFVPVDPLEARDQDYLMRSHGITAPHLLLQNEPSQGHMGVQMAHATTASLPVASYSHTPQQQAYGGHGVQNLIQQQQTSFHLPGHGLQSWGQRQGHLQQPSHSQVWSSYPNL